MVSAYAQYQLNIYGKEIIDIYNLTSVEFSALFTAPMLPAVFLSLIAGKISDVIGSRKVIGIGLLITFIGLVGRQFTDSYVGMVWFMMLTGFTAIAVTVNAAKILGGIFSPKLLSLAMGFYITGSMLAQTFATAVSPSLFSNMKIAFMSAIVFGLIITVCWWIGLFAFPEKGLREIEKKQTSLKEVITNSGVWITGFCLLFTLGATVTLSMFLPVALMETGKCTQAQAGTVTAMISLGNLLGAILGPMLFRKLKSLKVFLSMTGIISAAGCIFGWRLENIALLMIAMLITGVFLGSAMPVYFSTPMYLRGISKQNVSTTSGLITTMQLAGAVVMPTYVFAPIAKNNYGLMFLLAGMCMIIIPFLSIVLDRKSEYFN